MLSEGGWEGTCEVEGNYSLNQVGINAQLRRPPDHLRISYEKWGIVRDKCLLKCDIICLWSLALFELSLRAIKQKVMECDYILSEHAEMEAEDDNLEIEDIEEAIFCSDLIEEDIDDPRGHKCLLLGWSKEKPVHILCGMRGGRLAIITVYVPDLGRWMEDYRTRRKEDA